jgi:alpha-ketoglutarate-dependent taurine dioxygenase
VYNDGESDATITVRSPETRELSFTLKPKELRRLRTGWRDPSTSVAFDITNGQALCFDNLAYLHQ